MVIRKENIIMKKYYILISLFTFLLMDVRKITCINLMDRMTA